MARQHKDVVEPWLWLEVVDDDDWTEFILFSEQSIGDRLRLTRGEAGVVVVVGTGELQVDEVTYANELRSDENEGVGLTIGLGYGVKFKLLLTCWPLLLFAPNEGVGFEAKRWRHDGDGERVYCIFSERPWIKKKKNKQIKQQKNEIIQIFSC